MAITKRSTKGTSLTYNEMDDNFEAIAPRTSAEGSLQLPSGSTSQRDTTPVNGYIRYNSTLNQFEGYVSGQWERVESTTQVGTANQNAFSEFIIAGQTSILADAVTDSITFANNAGISITTDPLTSTITFENTSIQDFAFSSLTGVPTTISGYGITDAFDGDYANLTNTPTIPTNNNELLNGAGYISSFTETDPIFTASAAANIISSQVTNWDTAYGWGDHSVQGYITTESNDLTVGVTWVTVPDLYVSNTAVVQHQADLSITESQISDLGTYITEVPAEYLTETEGDARYIATETDPVFSAHTTSNIVDGVGYLYNNGSGTWIYGIPGGGGGSEVNDLTSVVTWTTVPNAYISESSVTQHQAALSITESQISDFGSYLADDYTYTETDPIFAASPVGSVTTTQVNNWDTAYGWGDHSTQGYLTGSGITETDPVFTAATVSSITDGTGYLTNDGSGNWSYVSPSTFITQGNETVTTLTADSVNQKLVYTDEDGTQNDVSLAWTIDDTNLARLTSGSIDSNTKIATFTRDDATTFTIDFSSIAAPLTGLVDGDFTSEGLMKRGQNAGDYEIITDNSSNWNTAYGWGDHSTAGYSTTSYSDSDVDTHLNQGSASAGQLLSWNGSDYQFTDPPASGIALTDFSVITNTPGSPTLSYNNSTGAFTYTPPDLSSYLTGETSHADVVVDGDFATAGLMKRGVSAGSYTTIADNSGNWDTAYGWGDHSQAGYATGTLYTDTDVDNHLNSSTATVNQILSWTGADYDWITLTTSSYGDSDVDTHLNQASAGTNNVLIWDGTDYAWTTQVSGGIAAVNDDTSPSLGGHLDLNGYKIDGTDIILDASNYVGIPSTTLAGGKLVLNSGQVGTPTSSNTNWSYIEVERGSLANVSLRWNEGTDKWEFTNNGTSWEEMGSNTPDWSSIQNTPTTISGYGITDAYDNSEVDTHLNLGTAQVNEVLTWDGSDYAWSQATGGAAATENVNYVTISGSTTILLANEGHFNLSITSASNGATIFLSDTGFTPSDEFHEFYVLYVRSTSTSPVITWDSNIFWAYPGGAPALPDFGKSTLIRFVSYNANAVSPSVPYYTAFVEVENILPDGRGGQNMGSYNYSVAYTGVQPLKFGGAVSPEPGVQDGNVYGAGNFGDGAHWFNIDGDTPGYIWGHASGALYCVATQQFGGGAYQPGTESMFESNQFKDLSSTAANSPFMSPDGLKYYKVTNDYSQSPSGYKLQQHTVGTAFDLSTIASSPTNTIQITDTATNQNFYDSSGNWGRPTHINFSSDGTKLFIGGRIAVLARYDLSVAWDISTVTFSSGTIAQADQAVRFQSSTSTTSSGSWFMTKDGSQVWFQNNQTGAIMSVNIPTPYDLSSVTNPTTDPVSQGDYSNESTAWPSNGYPAALLWSEATATEAAGKYFFMIRNASGTCPTCHRGTCSTPYDLSTITWDEILPTGSNIGALRDQNDNNEISLTINMEDGIYFRNESQASSTDNYVVVLSYTNNAYGLQRWVHSISNGKINTINPLYYADDSNYDGGEYRPFGVDFTQTEQMVFLERRRQSGSPITYNWYITYCAKQITSGSSTLPGLSRKDITGVITEGGTVSSLSQMYVVGLQLRKDQLWANNGNPEMYILKMIGAPSQVYLQRIVNTSGRTSANNSNSGWSTAGPYTVLDLYNLTNYPQNARIADFVITPDGTRIICVFEDASLHQWSMSSAWDITSTITHNGSQYIPIKRATAHMPTHIRFNSDGTLVYIVNRDGMVYQYSVLLDI
jgi:hypothetical protein